MNLQSALPLLMMLCLMAGVAQPSLCLAQTGFQLAQPRLPLTDIATTMEPKQVTSNTASLLTTAKVFRDPHGRYSPDAVIAKENAANFVLFNKRQLRQSGTTWLLLSKSDWEKCAVASGAEPGDSLKLVLGRQAPIGTTIWLYAGSDPVPMPLQQASGGSYALPKGSNDQSVLIQLTGHPGLWFRPAIVPAQRALPSNTMHYAALATIFALGVLSLLRGMTERREDRFWLGIFILAAFVHAWSSVPASPAGSLTSASLPRVLGTGLALMLLPHIGRQIMHTREYSTGLDFALQATALLGPLLVLTALWPGLGAVGVWLDIWPLGAAFCLIPALFMLWREVPGSGLYNMACLSLSLGAGLGLWGVYVAVDTPILVEAPLWSIVIASFLLSASPRYALLANDEESTHWNDEPAPYEHESDPSLARTSALQVENDLRPALDTLLREACVLDQIMELSETNIEPDMANKIRRHTDELVKASQQLHSQLDASPATNPLSGLVPPINADPTHFEIFNLHELVQTVVNAVRAETPGKPALAWYIAPHLGLLYKGDKDGLTFILTMLCRDAVAASGMGAVSLRVRRSEMSVDPGHLQFTISDTGRGKPPDQRGSLMLAKIWELTAAHNGELFFDSSQFGVDISFGLSLQALADDGVTPLPVPPVEAHPDALPVPNPLLVILASNEPLYRQLLAYYLYDQGLVIWEARDADEAVALYTHTPAALVVFDGQMPEADISAAIAAIRAFEGVNALPVAQFLALSQNDAQAGRLAHVGCDFSLIQPVIRGEYVDAVKDLTMYGGNGLSASLRTPLAEAYAEVAPEAPVPSPEPAFVQQATTPPPSPPIKMKIMPPTVSPTAERPAEVKQQSAPVIQQTPPKPAQDEKPAVAGQAPHGRINLAPHQAAPQAKPDRAPDLPPPATPAERPAAVKQQSAPVIQQTPPKPAQDEKTAVADQTPHGRINLAPHQAAPQAKPDRAPDSPPPAPPAERPTAVKQQSAQVIQQTPPKPAQDEKTASQTPRSRINLPKHQTPPQAKPDHAPDSPPPAPPAERPAAVKQQSAPIIQQAPPKPAQSDKTAAASQAPHDRINLATRQAPTQAAPGSAPNLRQPTGIKPEKAKAGSEIPTAKPVAGDDATLLQAWEQARQIALRAKTAGVLTEATESETASASAAESVSALDMLLSGIDVSAQDDAESQAAPNRLVAGFNAESSRHLAPGAAASQSEAEAQKIPQPGLYITPSSKKHMSWISSFFKPTPKVEPSSTNEPFLGSDWVGEPMPIGTPMNDSDSQIPAPSEPPPPGIPESAAADKQTVIRRGAPPHLIERPPDYAGKSKPQNPARTPSQAAWKHGDSQDLNPVAFDSGVEVVEPLPINKSGAPQSANAVFKVKAEPVFAPEVVNTANIETENPYMADDFFIAPEDVSLFQPQVTPRILDDGLPEIAWESSEIPEPPILPEFTPAAGRPAPAAPLTFLSLDPNGQDDFTANPVAEEIVELTEADIIEPPQPALPNLTVCLQNAIPNVEAAIAAHDAAALYKTASNLSYMAKMYEIHTLSDLADFMAQASQRQDFETVLQLIPELQNEVERNLQ